MVLTRASTCASVTVFRDIRKLWTYVSSYCATKEELRCCRLFFRDLNNFDKTSKFGVFVKDDIVIILKLALDSKTPNRLLYIVNYNFLLSIDVYNFLKKLNKRFPMYCENSQYVEILNMLT